MHDEDGPHIAESIYKALFKNGVLNMDPDEIPFALDLALQQLREKKIEAIRWAPYIHIGV